MPWLIVVLAQFREPAVRLRVEIVAALTIWTATLLAPDILSPPPGSCIQPSSARDRRDVSIKHAAALLAVALALSAVPSRAAETITVEGNRRIDAETVRSYFHASADGRYDATARDDALKALVATNLFDKV